MTIVCNIWMICWELNWFVYDPSWMLHPSEFVWALRSSVWVVFKNFLLIDATDRSKISSNQKRFFIALSLYPLSFFANTPFNSPFAIQKWSYNRVSKWSYILVPYLDLTQTLNHFWSPLTNWAKSSWKTWT